MFEQKSTKETLENGERNLIAPFADVYFSKDAYHILLDMPGVSKDNFKVKVDKDELIISGYLGSGDKQEYIYNERFYSGYHRHFRIPNDVDVDKIAAHYENGVLNLTLNKREEFKPKFIEIN